MRAAVRHTAAGQQLVWRPVCLASLRANGDTDARHSPEEGRAKRKLPLTYRGSRVKRTTGLFSMHLGSLWADCRPFSAPPVQKKHLNSLPKFAIFQLNVSARSDTCVCRAAWSFNRHQLVLVDGIIIKTLEAISWLNGCSGIKEMRFKTNSVNITTAAVPGVKHTVTIRPCRFKGALNKRGHPRTLLGVNHSCVLFPWSFLTHCHCQSGPQTAATAVWWYWLWLASAFPNHWHSVSLITNTTSQGLKQNNGGDSSLTKATKGDGLQLNMKIRPDTTCLFIKETKHHLRASHWQRG